MGDVEGTTRNAAGSKGRASGPSEELEGRKDHRRLDRWLVFEAYERRKLREESADGPDEGGRGRGGRRLGEVDAGGETWRFRPEPGPRQPAEPQAQPEGATIALRQDEQRDGEPARVKLFDAVPRIEGKHIVLGRVADGDADALVDLIENPLVQRYEPTYLFEKQRDDVRETIRLLYGDLFANKESLILAIRMKDTGELAGLAEFYGLRDRLHKASIGYRLRESWWGRGLATEAARLMVDYLYDVTDIEVITASTMVENAASAHVLEKAGFIRTARAVEEDWGFPEPTIVDKWFC